MTQKNSFWSTIPGILTGTAGVITAIAGLLTILFQLGIINPKIDKVTKEEIQRAVEETLETAKQAATTLEELVPRAEKSEERALLESDLELIREFIREVGISKTSHLKQGEITVYPEEGYLFFIVQKDNPRPAFNVLIRLSNNGQQVGIVTRLEAVLTGPKGVSFSFLWHLFYDRKLQRGGQLHTLSSYTHDIPIPPGGSELLGIQFIGPDQSTSLYSWPLGKYQVEMIGWVNRRPGYQPANLRLKFYIDISSDDVAELKTWIGWDDAAWARFPHPDFPDPDNAAARSVRIILEEK